MAFDFKKEYKEFYMPKNKPSILTVPPMNYIAVRGHGDPNQEGGEYKQAIGLLYGIAFTIKMSKKGNHQMKGYFDYVVPPLEGFWWQDGISGVDYAHKEDFDWISAIRLPDFVAKADFDWAVEEAAKKKNQELEEYITQDKKLLKYYFNLIETLKKYMSVSLDTVIKMDYVFKEFNKDDYYLLKAAFFYSEENENG